MALKIDAKFKEKATCAFKNDMRNLANMHRLKINYSKFNKTFYTCLIESSLFLGLSYLSKCSRKLSG